MDRRRFLMGSGAALSLPLFQSWPGTAHAAAAPAPKRLIIVYCGQGMPMHHWRPIGTPAAYTLNDIFQERHDAGGDSFTLADFKSDLSVVTGMNVASAMAESGNAHNQKQSG